MKIGTKVKLTDDAKENTYNDMDWKDDILIITHSHQDSEGMGNIYSFDNVTSNSEITCSMYAYELEEI